MNTLLQSTGVLSEKAVQEACLPQSTDSRFPRPDQVPPEFQLGAAREQRSYLVAGELRHWNGPQQEVLSPVVLDYPDGKRQAVVGSYPLLTQTESAAALAAAKAAYADGLGLWPQMSAEQRIQCVENFLDGMLQKRAEIVNLIMWEIGKTLPDARGEFDRTVEYVRQSIVAYRELDAAAHNPIVSEGVEARVSRNPLGVVLCMGPFNYPLNETFTTLMPALLTGNTIVFKPPKLGVLLHEPLLELFQKNFPPGVVNTIYGDGQEVVNPIVRTGEIDVLAFIGSSAVADIVARQHPAPHRLTKVLGLGAKNPAIVLPGANLDTAIPEIVKGALTYNGQRCTALKEIFVPREYADEIVERMADVIGKRKSGVPWEPGILNTPLPEPGKAQWMDGYVQDAVAHGARIVNDGGGRSDMTYFSPALLYPVTPEMKIYSEEQFGPVVPVIPYDSIETVVRAIASSPLGQGVSIFGSDEAQMGKLAAQLRNSAARINLNTQCQRGPDILPFAARRSSGMGTLSITDALKIFTVETVIAKKAH